MRGWLLYFSVWLVREYGRARGYKVMRGKPRLVKRSSLRKSA